MTTAQAWSGPAPRVARRRRANPLLLPLAFFAVTLGLIIVHQARVLELFYPVAAFLVGGWLYRRHPAHYVGFVCWLFFLSPEVRRFADFFKGAFNPTSTIQVAPLAVSLFAGFTLLRHWRMLGQRRGMPVLLIILSMFYGFAVGALNNSPAAVAFASTAWVFPVLVGFHMLATWERYEDYRRVIVRTFIWGTLLMGAYGIYEFVVMPPWDAFWLLGSGMHSEGDPVPFGIRIASTMNSAGPFAVTAMAGLLFLQAGTGKVRWLAGGLGFLALIFTFVRAAWGGLIVGLIYTFFTLNNRKRFQLVLSLLVTVALAMPLLTIDKLSGRVMDRVDSIINLHGDTSFNDRTQFYNQFLDSALSDIAGQGFGSTGQATKLSNDNHQLGRYGNFDSGLMELPFVLGWPGVVLFLGGTMWLLARAMILARRNRGDSLAAAGTSIGLSVYSLLIFYNSMNGTSGLFFYIGVMLPAIAYRYKRSGLKSTPQ